MIYVHMDTDMVMVLVKLSASTSEVLFIITNVGL